MDILGSIGKLYTFLLLVVLFLGSGLAVWAGINAIMSRKDNIKENTNKIKDNLSVKLQNMKNNNIIGGISMKNNGFIKLAVFSFVGIIISAAILAALPNYTNSTMNNMNMSSGYTTTSMNMQGMTGYSTGSMTTGTDLYSIQQQLNYMQQQIYQLQNQMNSMNMNSMNNSGSINSSGSMNGSSSNSSGNSNSSSMSSMPMM